MKLKLKRLPGFPNAQLPSKGSAQASGFDLYSCELRYLSPGLPHLFPVGFSMELPSGYEAQIRPRSGLALKYGITVLNAPGTIDADYRGPIGVLLINHGPCAILIKEGDRIAQMVIQPVESVSCVEFVDEELSLTERGEGGFGSSGV